jgi:hypothetical protein
LAVVCAVAAGSELRFDLHRYALLRYAVCLADRVIWPSIRARAMLYAGGPAPFVAIAAVVAVAAGFDIGFDFHIHCLLMLSIGG